METQCGTGKPVTRKLQRRSRRRWMLGGEAVGTSLLVFVQSDGGFLDASAASRSVGSLTGEGGCCLSWQPLRSPAGLIGCQTSAHEKANQMGGRDGAASGNLTTCLPALLRPSLPSSTSVQQGKLYRPKGRLTSPEL